MNYQMNLNKKSLQMQFWEELHLKADFWLKELDFMADELRFLKEVITNYLKDVNADVVDQIEPVQKLLTELELKRHLFRAEVIDHRDMLKQKLITQSEQEFSEVKLIQESLKEKYNEVNRLNRQFKESLFQIVDDVYGD